jgi:hypothetical protein
VKQPTNASIASAIHAALRISLGAASDSRAAPGNMQKDVALKSLFDDHSPNDPIRILGIAGYLFEPSSDSGVLLAAAK